jgi:hypothetical protein
MLAQSKSLCEEMVAKDSLIKVTYENYQNGDVMSNIPQMGKFWSSTKAELEIATDGGATPQIALRDEPSLDENDSKNENSKAIGAISLFLSALCSVRLFSKTACGFAADKYSCQMQM